MPNLNLQVAARPLDERTLSRPGHAHDRNESPWCAWMYICIKVIRHFRCDWYLKPRKKVLFLTCAFDRSY